jgi:hypothetical protein
MANTHLGVPVDDIVLLQWTGWGGNPGDVKRILPDGELISNFELPGNMFLIITDVEWRVNTFTGVNWVEAILRSRSPANLNLDPYVTFVPVNNAVGYRHDHLTSPLVVHPSVKFGLTGPGPTFAPMSSQGFTVTLRGYLLRAQPGGGPKSRSSRG